MQNYTNGTPPSQKYRTTENEKSGEGEVKPIKSVQPVQAWHLHYSNTGAKKKNLFAPIENTKAVPLPRLLVNCSSTAHLLPVQLKVVIINKMKNEPVREQFSHCAEVWARYPSTTGP